MKTRISLQTTSLLVFSLLVMGIFGTIEDDRAGRCSGVTLETHLLSQSELQNQRNFVSNSFFSNYTTLFDFYNNTNSSNFLKLINWQFGLYITLVLLIVVMFIISFIFCCVKYTARDNLKSAMYVIFLILFVIFIALFITMIVFLAIGQNRLGKARCSLYTVPAAFLYGSPQAYHQQEFIGIKTFANIISAYQKGVTGITNTLNDSNAIIAAQVGTLTQTMINDQRSFKLPITSVSFGNVTNFVPDVISKSVPTISNDIESEFNNLGIVGTTITTSASEAKFMQDPAYVTYTVTNLNDMNSLLTNSFNNYTTLTDGFASKEQQAQNYLLGGFWTFFGIGIIIIIIGIIIIICYATEKSGKGFLFLIILIIFFSIIFGIMVLILMAGLANLGAFCNFIGELNQGGWNALNTFNIYIQGNSSNLIKNCFFSNSTGYMPDAFNSTQYTKVSYNRLINLINGMTVYDRFSNKTTSFSNTISAAVNRQINQWNLIGYGYIPDNYYALTTFLQLKSLQSCDSSVNFAMTAKSCQLMNMTGCTNIASAPTFTPSSCVSDKTTTSNLYTALNTYINYESNLTNWLVTNTDNATYVYDYQTSIQQFKAIQPNVNNLKTTFTDALNYTKTFNNTLNQTIQCSNLQADMQQLERYACVNYMRPLFVLFCVAAFATLMLLFIGIFLLALYTCFEGKEREEGLPRDLLAVSEQELVPKY